MSLSLKNKVREEEKEKKNPGAIVTARFVMK